MATRPVFYCNERGAYPGAREMQIEFQWYPGFSVAQKQRSIASLHSSIISTADLRNPLEISSKSAISVGVALSAFNLQLRFLRDPPLNASVETVYQGSKIYDGLNRKDNDRYFLKPREARMRAREYEACHELSGWAIGDYCFDLSSGTEFYDWLYIGALYQQLELLQQLVRYDCFTDIEFNPKKSLACQARSAALARSEYLSHGSLLPYLKSVAASRSRSRDMKPASEDQGAIANSEPGMQLSLEL